MFKIIKYLIEYFVGDCGTCKHEKDCIYIKNGEGSCFDITGFTPYYEKKK